MSTYGNKDCDRALELELMRASGLRLDLLDEQWLHEHLSSCPTCRAEQNILSLLEDDGGPGAARPYDEVSRRRAIDDILAKADDLAFPVFEIPQDEPRRILPYRAISYAAVAAAACFALAFAWIWQSGQQAPLPTHQAGVATAMKALATLPLSGRYTLVAGDASSGLERAAVGDELTRGDSVETHDGRAVLHFPTGIIASLGPQSKLSLSESNAERIELLLSHGAVLLSVDPGRKGPRLSVTTADGRLEVTGTIFEVVSDAESTEVQVLRGKVQVDPKNATRQRVAADEALLMGESMPHPLSADEREALWQGVKMMELLEEQIAGQIEIRSLPLGADVAIDGVDLGATPVSAAIRAGHRELTLSVGQQEIVRELIDIGKGETLSRVFDLGDTLGASDSQAPTAPQGAARRTATQRMATAVELLAEAQSRRAERDFAAAAKAYELLVKRYPNADEAASARVSLGVILLEKLSRPREALFQFEVYLATTSSGPLAQEAMLSKAHAEGALGNTAAEKATLQRFLEQFPAAIQRLEVERRLSEI